MKKIGVSFIDTVMMVVMMSMLLALLLFNYFNHMIQTQKAYGESNAVYGCLTYEKTEKIF